MNFEQPSDNSDRYKRRQRLLAYIGIAAFATGITVTLGTVMGLGSSEHGSDTSGTAQESVAQAPTAAEAGDRTTAVVFGAAVGGLAVLGGVIVLRPVAGQIREYINTPPPDAQIPAGRDEYIDTHFRQLVEPLRGKMPEDCGW